MEDFNGIVSLLVACIELGLFANILIFAEKNNVNKLIMLLIALLFTYQLLEFLLCFVELQSEIVVYLSLFTISFLPPLSLLLLLRFYNIKSKSAFFIFSPALFFVIYYLFVFENIAVAKCTVLYAVYNYPFGMFYGSIYYLPILISIVLLIVKLKKEEDANRKKLSLILLLGYIATFIPGLLINIFVPGAFTAIESILCKLALIFAMTHALFALKNKSLTVSQ